MWRKADGASFFSGIRGLASGGTADFLWSTADGGIGGFNIVHMDHESRKKCDRHSWDILKKNCRRDSFEKFCFLLARPFEKGYFINITVSNESGLCGLSRNCFC